MNKRNRRFEDHLSLHHRQTRQIAREDLLNPVAAKASDPSYNLLLHEMCLKSELRIFYSQSSTVLGCKGGVDLKRKATFIGDYLDL
jgi:hypothetical protein